MNLRTRTLRIIGVTLVCLLALLYAISNFILLNSFERLEYQTALENVERLRNGLSDNLAAMNTSNADWAQWDDTYLFVQGENADYVEANLYPEALTTLKINFMVFADLSGNILHTVAVDLETGEETALPEGLAALITADNPLVTPADIPAQAQGIIQLLQGPILITSQPIMTSSQTGPAEGSLIMGRYLDSPFVQRLSDSLRLTISVRPAADDQLPEDFRSARAALENGAEVFISALSNQTVAGYTSLDDVFGNPALLLRVEMPRAIYQQGQTTLAYLVLAILVAGLVFGAAMLVLLQNNILNRLSDLVGQVEGISASPNLSERVMVKGQDELTRLGHGVNKMLAALEQSEADNRALIQAIPDTLLRVDRQGQILDCRPASDFPTSLLSETAVGKNLFQLVASADLKIAEGLLEQGMAHLQKTLESGKPQTFVFEITIAQQLHTFEARLAAVGERQNEVLTIIQDVTERKQTEEAEKAVLLLKETHHRVKNNLQVISSLLSLQSRDFEDPHVIEKFEDSQNRVISMALIHEKLYGTDRVGEIDFGQYVNDLVSQLRSSYDAYTQGIKVVVTASNVALDIDAAVPCGLMVNELISNVFKHGFPDGRTGEVNIEVFEDDADQLAIVVRDNGVGMPQAFDFERARTLGLRLVKQLVAQLEGTVTLQSDNGCTRFNVRLPMSGKRPR